MEVEGNHSEDGKDVTIQKRGVEGLQERRKRLARGKRGNRKKDIGGGVGGREM